MTFKTSYPFIYFLENENQVLVCEIRTNDYITISDLSSELEGDPVKKKLYHLGNTPFQSFNHTTAAEVKTSGFTIFVPELDLYQRAKIINKMIQQHRVPSNEPVHLAVGGAQAGALRFFLKRPKKVIAFYDDLSEGPIRDLPSESGYKTRMEWLKKHNRIESYQDCLNVETALLEIEDIPRTAPVTIWAGGNAFDQAGKRFFLSLLKDRKNSIFLAEADSLFLSGDTKDIERLEEGKRELGQREKTEYIEQWTALSSANSMLRVWGNGVLEEAPANYFDGEILTAVNRLQENEGDFIPLTSIQFEVSGALSSAFVNERVWHLLMKGRLTIDRMPIFQAGTMVKSRE
ncbi:DUF1835 domain-containing protein [Metabacillus sp. GX 13764]|uniref:DUF1835 domain-containing protein n=1 Tax=Metabacillus kandeliae TaxID=2900151 RepID=UPI001E33F11D|nr:DUF1835 domain-containing protein [Metabacillus kandeliae]MCD7036389.1 DUF1835 domain-containing protein [Metabacillus kandeliae]